MQPNLKYVYSVFLVNGPRLAQYAGNDTPPRENTVISLLIEGAPRSFEVLEVSRKHLQGYESVILKVRPAQM